MSADPAPTDAVDQPAPTRHWFVRVPSAILIAFVVTSIVLSVWVHLIGDHVPDAVNDLVGPLLLFVLAPVLTATFLRGSRWPVRLGVALFAAWIWVFWLFLVLIPVTG